MNDSVLTALDALSQRLGEVERATRALARNLRQLPAVYAGNNRLLIRAVHQDLVFLVPSDDDV